MADKRAPGRSLDEWMKLVTECRQSGLTDEEYPKVCVNLQTDVR